MVDFLRISSEVICIRLQGFVTCGAPSRPGVCCACSLLMFGIYLHSIFEGRKKFTTNLLFCFDVLLSSITDDGCVLIPFFRFGGSSEFGIEFEIICENNVTFNDFPKNKTK